MNIHVYKKIRPTQVSNAKTKNGKTHEFKKMRPTHVIDPHAPSRLTIQRFCVRNDEEQVFLFKVF